MALTDTRPQYPGSPLNRTPVAQQAAVADANVLTRAQGAPGSMRAQALAGGPAALTSMGAQLAGQRQQAATGVLQGAVQAQSADAQGALQDEKLAREGVTQDFRLALSRQARELGTELSARGMSAEQELFSGNLQFERDEIGRAVLNERQLADYAVGSARSQEELQNYEMQVAQTLERKQAMMKAAFAVLEQQEQQLFAQSEQELNQELAGRIAVAKKKLQDDMGRLASDAANSAAIWGGVTAVGMAVTPIFAPAGLAVTAVGVAGGAVSASQHKDAAAARQKQGNTI